MELENYSILDDPKGGKLVIEVSTDVLGRTEWKFKHSNIPEDAITIFGKTVSDDNQQVVIDWLVRGNGKVDRGWVREQINTAREKLSSSPNSRN